MNLARKIIYAANYNPIREYWEQIKDKPLFVEIERLEAEISEASKKENVDATFLIKKQEELEKRLAEKHN